MGTTLMDLSRIKLLGPQPPAWFIPLSDGCTRVPDKFKFADWHRACVTHDYGYSRYCKIRRVMADAYLLVNMIKLGAPWRIAMWYFIGVRFLGWRHFEKYDPTA